MANVGISSLSLDVSSDGELFVWTLALFVACLLEILRYWLCDDADIDCDDVCHSNHIRERVQLDRQQRILSVTVGV